MGATPSTTSVSSSASTGRDIPLNSRNDPGPSGRSLASTSQSRCNDGTLPALTPSPLLSSGRASPSQRILAACSGALVTSVVVTPLDVVKVRMQAQVSSAATPTSSILSRRHPALGASASTYVYCTRFFDHVEPCTCRTLYIFDRPHSTRAAVKATATTATMATAMHATSPRITGTLDGVLKIGRQEGVTGLWRGLSPTLLMAVPATVIYYLGYETLKEKLLQSTQGTAQDGSLRFALSTIESKASIVSLPPVMAPLLAGAAARVIAVTCISPLELIKTKMQNYGASPALIAGDLQRSIRQRGILAVLYKGLVPTLWRDVPFSAIYWAGYERCRQTYAGWLPAPKRPVDHFALSFAAGATAGGIAAALTTPFDVAKTRQQVSNDAAVDAGSRRGIVRHLRDIWRAEGVAGLTLGIGPRICKVAPSCAIMIGCYEFTKNYLGG